MFPVPWPIIVVRFVAFALLGWGIGVLTGWFVTLLTRNRPTAALKNGLLGSGGFLAAFLITALMPWPRNTITYQLDGGVTGTSTMSGYQHPEWVALGAAILLPLLYELYRWRKRNSAKLA